MSAFASLNAARSSLMHRDTTAQEVEEDVFQEDFALPVGLDHTKCAFVLPRLLPPPLTHLPPTTGFWPPRSRTAKASPTSNSSTAQQLSALCSKAALSLPSTAARAWAATWPLRPCRSASPSRRTCLEQWPVVLLIVNTGSVFLACSAGFMSCATSSALAWRPPASCSVSSCTATGTFTLTQPTLPLPSFNHFVTTTFA